MTHTLDVPYLVAEYEAGRSAASLARELHVDVSAVRRRLERAGVAIRTAREATAANLARDPSILTGMGRPRTWPVNERYFDRLTPTAAYIIGLMQADGCNRPDRGAVTLALKWSDVAHVETVAAEMGATRPVRSNGKGAAVLYVQNRALSAGLAQWGVVSPKTHTASTHPVLLTDRDYWRGAVDGDGTLCEARDGRRILALVGSRPICDQFLAFCRSHGAGLRCNVTPHKAIWSAHLSGWAATAVAGVLYSGATLALPRKAATAERWAAS